MMWYSNFQHYSYIRAASASIHAFLEFLLPVPCIIFFQNHWLLSRIIIIERIVNNEKGMNPITMTVINLSKEVSLAKDYTCKFLQVYCQLSHQGSAREKSLCYGRPPLQAWPLPDLNTIPSNCVGENSL